MITPEQARSALYFLENKELDCWTDWKPKLIKEFRDEFYPEMDDYLQAVFSLEGAQERLVEALRKRAWEEDEESS